MTKITTGFLTHYDDPIRETLPKERLYPLGQTMQISAWHCYGGGYSGESWQTMLDKLIAHKCTAIGPSTAQWFFPGSEGGLPAAYAYAKSKGLRASANQRTYLLPGPSPSFSRNDICYAANGTGYSDSQLLGGINKDIQDYYSKSPYDIIDEFVLNPEEWIGGGVAVSSCDTIQQGANKMSMLHKAVQYATGQECNTQATSTMNMTQKIMKGGYDQSIVEDELKQFCSTEMERSPDYSQEYWGNKDSLWYFLLFPAVHRGQRDGLAQTVKYLDTNFPLSNGRSRYAGVLLYVAVSNTASNPIDRQTPKVPGIPTGIQSSKAWASWVVWGHAVRGIKAFQQYNWHYMRPNTPSMWIRDSYLEQFKIMRTHKFDAAMLWGKVSPSGRRITVSDHGRTNSFVSNSTGYVYNTTPNVMIRDIQYLNARYIILTNENEQAHTVTLYGLPNSNAGSEEYYLVECTASNNENTKGSRITSTTKSVSMNPMTHKLYRITQDGYDPYYEVPLLTSKVKIAGAWREIKSSKIKINGTWKSIKDSKVKVNGIWEDTLLGTYTPPAEVFEITKHPQSVTKNVGNSTPIFFVEYTPSSGVSIQWQWRNPRIGQIAWRSVVNNNVDPSKYSMTKDIIVIGHDDDRFRAILTNNGIVKYSNEAILTVI